ncbi:MAG TPA: MFS transporter [Ornithinimicrobium sp.]|uniref:MFS transporter n=1 Tax=Ornithinimicrobium sp. TaxID=1977084 RepID=UPI002B474C62|nr:MFS transporter [Ornithinimicrobium sp.]HKJ11555.1 MFS transporter [Ornithinimicrobium sp.]
MTTPVSRPPTLAAESADATTIRLASIALVVGGFGIGVTEFVTMGLLPQIARGIGVDIPTAGHTISAYALGVVLGAPLLSILGAKAPRRAMLLGLMSAFAVGNALAAMAPNYETLMLARFVSGVPHGAFFGMASLVAVSLAPTGRSGRAVGRIMLGIPLANIVGVPAVTWLGQLYGWRTAYWVVAGVGVLTVVLVRRWVPRTDADPEQNWHRELQAFRSAQVWLTIGVGAVGFGGMFAMYSYIAPTVTEVTGRPESWVPVFLLAFGLGSIVGTWLGGVLADWSVLRSLAINGAIMTLLLLAFSVTAQWTVPAMLTVFAVSVVTGAWVIGLQMRLMSVAGAARNLGAAMNHASLNFANATGAFLGGSVIAAGYGYRAPSVVGAALALGGLLLLACSVAVHRRDTALELGAVDPAQ